VLAVLAVPGVVTVAKPVLAAEVLVDTLALAVLLAARVVKAMEQRAARAALGVADLQVRGPQVLAAEAEAVLDFLGKVAAARL
jgi:hypothetical protein